MVSQGAMMINLLGLGDSANLSLEKRLEALHQVPNAHLHWYGKTPETPGRKLGHVTVLLEGSDAASRTEEARRTLQTIRSIWPAAAESSDCF